MSESEALFAGEDCKDAANRAPFPVGDLIFALAGIATGIVVAVAAAGIRIPPGSQGQIGPRIFPYAVAGLIIISSVAVIISLVMGKRAVSEEGEDVDTSADTDWFTVAVLVILFCVFALLIKPAGWPVAVTVLFGGTAWKLGAKQWWRAIVIGLAIGLLTQYLFGTLLGISLPAGPVFEWIPIFNG